MQVKYINPFLAASVNLFKNYLGSELSNETPFVNKEPCDLDEVSAIIGLSGDVIGAVVLSFDRETAIKIVSKFAARQYVGLSSEVIDGVGELVNILAGNAKKDLNEFRIDISLPGVITGSKSKINWPSDVPVITIPFKSDMGKFNISVSIKGG